MSLHAQPPPFPGGFNQGPFNDETWVAFSKDGIKFSGHRLIFKHASVPDLVALKSGKILVYFVDFSSPHDGFERLGVGISADGGKTFQKLAVQIAGLSGLKAVDPDPFVLDDGRIRLYYFASRPPPADGGPRDPALAEGLHEVRSAVSKDGVRFVEEPGIRFAHEGLTDPDVVRLVGGSYRMYFPVHAGPQRGKVLSASSRDGLSFAKDPGIRFDGPSIPGAIALATGQVRLYLNGPGGIISLISDDGLNFEKEAVAIPFRFEEGLIADPGPARLPDGSYALVYKKRPGSQALYKILND